METKSCEKVAKNFNCYYCDYSTCRKSSLDKHNQTDKHKFMSNGDAGDEEKLQTEYNCSICKKIYNSRNGLWKHKKNCKHENITIIEDNQIDVSTLDMNLIMQLLKQNDEFKALMVEQNNKMM